MSLPVFSDDQSAKQDKNKDYAHIDPRNDADVLDVFKIEGKIGCARKNQNSRKNIARPVEKGVDGSLCLVLLLARCDQKKGMFGGIHQ